VFLGELFQPFRRNVGFDYIIERFQSFEEMAEHAIEFVQIALVLHQRRAREKIEILNLARGEIGIHSLHQRQIFAQRHRYARLLQFLEERNEHKPASLAALSRVTGGLALVKTSSRRKERSAPADAGLDWPTLAPVSTPGPRPHDTYESEAIFDATGVRLR